MPAFLSTHRIVAGPGFSRWWIIPAALCINLSVGQAYAFSVFNLPLTRLRGITAPVEGDWSLTTIGWIFTLAYVFLGLSAGVAGRWQDRVGPRISGLVAAGCFGGGFLVAALGVWLHQIWLLYLGYGVLSGCGLGLGFNTPIPVLLRWFPDRPGLATGFAVMGFGGGAIIAAPVSHALLGRFAGPSSAGVAETFVVLGLVYLLVMTVGALLFRLPPQGWRPPGWLHSPGPLRAEPTEGLTVEEAVRTRAFRLLWLMLLLNVTAGIGLLGQAAPMIQEVFNGLSASTAAMFVAALSFFNMGGRLVWAAVSDVAGRRMTFAVFFAAGAVLYAAVPLAGRLGSLPLFMACLAVILSMYGAGFALMPPYIAEVFGPGHVGAINGRVLTALSAAGVLGPVAVNYIRQFQIERGVSAARAYDVTLVLMSGLLLLGFACNRAVRPVFVPARRPEARPEAADDAVAIASPS
ncbi:MAG: OFA family MFS transporter [Acidobacteriota bacterium]